MRKYMVCMFLIVFLSLMATIVYMATIKTSEIVEDSIESINRSAKEFIPRTEKPIQDIEDEKKTQNNVVVSEPNGIREQSKTRDLVINIRDPFHEPIQDGVVILSTKNYPFKNGSLIIKDIKEKNRCNLTVQSPGYFEKSGSCIINPDNEIDVELDYCNDYIVHVQNKKINPFRPISGATVYLYKIYDVSRPIPDRIHIKFNNRDYQYKKTRLKIDDNDILVNFTSEENSDPLILSRDERFCLPDKGDKLNAVSSISWDENMIPEYKYDYKYYEVNQNIKSRHLVIWDSLFLLSGISSSKRYKQEDYVEFIKDTDRFVTKIFMSENEDITGNLIETKITGKDGICCFEKLPPALYRVYAEKDGQYTYHNYMYPIRNKVYMGLYADARVVISIIIKNYNKMDWGAYIQDAQITLKSNEDTKGTYLGKTTRMGQCEFDTIPFGNYQLSVILPEHINANNINKQININQPYQKFEYEIESDYKVSGTVICRDTGQKIANHPIQLFTGYPIFEIVKSDANGRFTISNVPDGNYFISTACDENVKYLPEENQFSKAPFVTKYVKGYAVSVKGDNVENILYYVNSIKKTTFKGIVLDVNKQSLRNAKMILNYPFFGKKYTDEHGRFEMILINSPYVPLRDIDRAQIGALFATDVSGHNIRNANQYGITNIQKGEEKVYFSRGDTVENIQIEMKECRADLMIHGEITLDDEPLPENFYNKIRIELIGTGNRFNDRYEAVLNDNKYSINGLLSGSYLMTARSTGKTINMHGEKYKDNHFCYYQQRINMEDDSMHNTYNINIIKSGHLSGIVLNKKNQPFESVRIKLTEEAKLFHEDIITKEEGGFYFGGLPPDRSFQLLFYIDDNEEPVHIYPDLQPTIDNIVVKIE